MYEMIDGEKWEVLPSGNYAISDHGRLMRTTHAQGSTVGRLIKTHIARGGYLTCRLQESLKKTRVAIHALVASTFIGPRPAGMVIHHLDGDTMNNRVGNLLYKPRGLAGLRKSVCQPKGFKGRVYHPDIIKAVKTAKLSPPPVIDHESGCIEGELWQVLMCGHYAISSFGRMMRTTTASNTFPGKLLKARYNTKGYIQFVITDRMHVQSHRMVAEYFIGTGFDEMQVNHIDGVPYNNHVSNLEYVTALDNVAHAMQSGLMTGGRKPIRGRARKPVKHRPCSQEMNLADVDNPEWVNR